MTVNKNTLTEKEVAFLDRIATTTENEREFLHLCLTANDTERVMLLNMVSCTAVFGMEFLNEAKPFVDSGDREGIIRVTEKYTAKLKEANT